MQLTRVERWMLANQFAIRAKLEPESADHFAMAQEVMENGYEGAYGWFTNVCQEDDVLSDADVTEVIDILDMFRMAQAALRDLPDTEGIDPARLRFEGFDGNHDKQYGFSTILARQGKYTESLGAGGVNSHSTVLPRYRRKLAAWEESADKYKLTKEDLARIAKA